MTPAPHTSAMVESELKPCPFCGGKPTLLEIHEPIDHFVREYIIRCDACALERHGEYETDAVESWDTRAASSPARVVDSSAAFRLIDNRLADLRNSNRVYKADSRLSAQDNIHRNDREIRFLKDLRSELSLLPAPADGGWQDIASAPKDFTTIVDLWADGERWPDCFWGTPTYDGSEYTWVRHGYDDCDGPVYWKVPNPTHWRPLPAPPTSHPAHHQGGDE